MLSTTPLNNRLIGTALVASFLYALLCWAIMSESPVLIGFLQRVPGWAGWLVVTAIGPASFLNARRSEWMFFTTSIVMIVACLVGAAYFWKRLPHSEIFCIHPLRNGDVGCCGWFVVLANWT